MQLNGPEYTGPATDLSHHAGVGTISLLMVYPGGGIPQVQTLAPALGILRNYFEPLGASVVLYLRPTLFSQSLLQQMQNACGVPVSFSNAMSVGMTPLAGISDFQNEQTITSQMSADSQQQQVQRWKILETTQFQIFQIQQSVTANQSKTAGKALKAWDQYIRR